MKTEVSVLNHETGRSLRLFPAESRSCAWKLKLVSVKATLALSGITVTVATEPFLVGATTWTTMESARPPLVTLIVANPGWRPLTEAMVSNATPTGNTIAIDVSPLVQVTDGCWIGLPFASPTATASTIDPPTPTDDGPEMRTYAPFEPASGRDTDSCVVSPARTCTFGVTTAMRSGRSMRSIRTTYVPALTKGTV